MQTITLGGGCFWCIEASYQLIRGITGVTSGYAGGSVPDPTYGAVSGGKTGHAEVVRVEFDEGQITLDDVLDIFWAMHDPTTLNQQGADVGTQYRSIILYADDEQKRIAEASKSKVQALWNNPVVTEIVPLDKFYEAEPEHQDYFKRNPAAAYCQVVINPKLNKLRQKYGERIVA